MSIAVVSSIYGSYDQPKIQPDQSIDAEWIMVTDREIDVPGWKVVVEPRPHLHPCLAAKIPKCLPGLYTDAETTVWIDGSCQMLGEGSLKQIIDGSGGSPQAQIMHPDRDCVYDEAAFCVPIPKYADLPMLQQVKHYRETWGHPEHWGLWATGMIVRNYDWSTVEQVQRLGRAWLIEQMRWGFQDQLSEAVVMRHILGTKIYTLPFPLHGSGLFEWHAGHH